MDPYLTSTGPLLYFCWTSTGPLLDSESTPTSLAGRDPQLPCCKGPRLLSQLDTPTALAVGDPHFAGFRGPPLLWLYKTITSVAAVDLPPLWLLEAPTCLAVGDPHCFGCRRPPLLWLSETPTSDRRARGYRDEVALGPLGAYSRCFLCWWVVSVNLYWTRFGPLLALRRHLYESSHRPPSPLLLGLY